MSEKKAFGKEQFMSSKRRQGVEKDIAAAALEDGKMYTLKEAEKRIQDFKKRKVE